MSLFLQFIQLGFFGAIKYTRKQSQQKRQNEQRKYLNFQYIYNKWTSYIEKKDYQREVNDANIQKINKTLITAISIFLYKNKQDFYFVLTFPSFKQFQSQYKKDNFQALEHQKNILLKLKQHSNHPNIIQLTDQGVANVNFFKTQYKECPFLIFQYAKLKNLQSYFNCQSERKEDLKQNFVFILNQLISGLHHMHKVKNILHLDIRPKNILQFDNYIFKFAGFKDSQTLQTFKQKLQQKNYKVGVNSFEAPQWKQKRNSGFFDGQKVDIYNLGLCMLLIYDKFEFKNSGIQWSQLLELKKLKGLDLKKSVQFFWLTFRRLKLEQNQRQYNSQIRNLYQKIRNQRQRPNHAIRRRIAQLEQLLQQNQLQGQVRRTFQRQLRQQRLKLQKIRIKLQQLQQEKQAIIEQRQQSRQQLESSIQQQKQLKIKIQQQTIKDNQKIQVNISQDQVQNVDQQSQIPLNQETYRQNVIKQIIVGMIHPDPQTRLTLQEIKNKLALIQDNNYINFNQQSQQKDENVNHINHNSQINNNDEEIDGKPTKKIKLNEDSHSKSVQNQSRKMQQK